MIPAAIPMPPCAGIIVSLSRPTISVDATYVYVTRDGQVLKFDKRTLQPISVASLPASAQAITPTPAMAGAGQGQLCIVCPSTVYARIYSMQQLQGEQYDAAFIQNMVERQRGAIAFSIVAATRACHPELRTFAHNVAVNRITVSNCLTAQLLNCYRAQCNTGISAADLETLAQLGSAGGADLERKYMRAMISHNNGTICIALNAEQRACNSFLRQFANSTTAILYAENMQLIQWLFYWYGETP